MIAKRSPLARPERILLIAGPGLDRGPLLARFAGTARLGCDLGQPDLGPPGAVTWHDATVDGWQLTALEGLATLDSARFRLPLCAAVSRLLRREELATRDAVLEVPAISRGAALMELPLALAAASGAQRAVLSWVRQAPCPLQPALEEAGLLVERVDGTELETSTGKSGRRQSRTARWDAYLADAEPVWLEDVARRLTGGQRPSSAELWLGRQVVLRTAEGDTVGLAEVRELRGEPSSPEALQLACPPDVVTHLAAVSSIFWRDARRDESGLLLTDVSETAPSQPRAREALPYQLRPRAEEVAALGPPTTTRSAGLQVTVVSSAFGDPLVHLRRPKQKRSLLLDLGETQRLPARLAHQVSDVMISHAHFDHVAGFLWLARARIGVAKSCRVFGPAEIAAQLQSMLAGITWNLLPPAAEAASAAAGPSFEVLELHDDLALTYRVRAGWTAPTLVGERRIVGGLLHEDDDLVISACTLDHHIPVLAYRLQAKQRDGTLGQRLVYATDFADTAQNRAELSAFAAGAHTLLCEASFIEDDRLLAESTAHLTARACGELAAAANATQLVPFHFSRRYEREPERVYAEVLAAFPRTVLPRRIAELLGQRRRRRDLGEG